MNPSAVILRGTLKEDGTLVLDESPNLPPGPVRVVVQPLTPSDASRPGLLKVLDQIHAAQRARGFKGRTKEGIDADIAAERAEEEEYEERWREIWAQTESRAPPNPDAQASGGYAAVQDNNSSGDPLVGRITVEILVSNNQDVQMVKGGALPPDKVRHFQLQATVDTGSTHLVLPEDVANRLGLPRVGEAAIRYADRQSATRPVVEQVQLELLGRRSTFRALVEPDRTTALIGAIVLGDLDFVVDCPNQRLVPRDPERITAEVE